MFQSHKNNEICSKKHDIFHWTSIELYTGLFSIEFLNKTKLPVNAKTKLQKIYEKGPNQKCNPNPFSLQESTFRSKLAFYRCPAVKLFIGTISANLSKRRFYQ